LVNRPRPARWVAPLTLALSLLASACASDAPAPQRAATPVASPADLSTYQLGIGDRVRVEVYGENDLSLDAVIDPGGRINYPLLGSIVAAKKTAKALQDDIAERLAAGYVRSPDVRVIVIGYRPFYMIGQVKKPGAYPYVVGLTVEKALALAGGLTNLASTRRMYILREDRPVDSRAKAELDTVIYPGDTLMVEEGLF
jgi:protein involved in polysaccharide export with SLBB domain